MYVLYATGGSVTGVDRLLLNTLFSLVLLFILVDTTVFIVIILLIPSTTFCTFFLSPSPLILTTDSLPSLFPIFVNGIIYVTQTDFEDARGGGLH